ncbi:aldo/keto reductase, partial [Eggerthella sinensis]|uniref:aldo/keto reductase n=1 Tax=Eggerthella sinensis TaxID=242230 RepID=UPI0022E6D95F
MRTRDMDLVRPAFEDLLARLGTDHVELGMIHYVDDVDEYEGIMAGPFIDYVRALKAAGTIEHIGLSTHSPEVGKRAALSGEIEMIMFSVNPAFDLLPASTSLEAAFAFDYDDALEGMDPARAELYALCEREDVGITVMKGYAGGRLFNAEASPFGVAMTPVQCIHYALTRPAAASIMAGFDERRTSTTRWPTRAPPTSRKTTRACSPARRSTPTSGSARTAATAPRARPASTSPPSTSSTTWPSCRTRCPPRCARTTARSTHGARLGARALPRARRTRRRLHGLRSLR